MSETIWLLMEYDELCEQSHPIGAYRDRDTADAALRRRVDNLTEKNKYLLSYSLSEVPYFV